MFELETTRYLRYAVVSWRLVECISEATTFFWGTVSFFKL